MRYFTPQLWLGFNSRNSKAAFKTRDRRLKAYRKNLEKILPNINPQARRFFRDVLVLYDGTSTRKTLEGPAALGPFKYVMILHERMQSDAAHVWLRSTIRELGKRLS